MKKLIALCLSLVLIGCAALATAETTYANILEKVKGEGKLVMGTSPDYAPYEFVDPTKTGQEQYVGADITLAKYIADYLGVELVIEPLGFDPMLAAVGMGTIDLALAGMVPKEERLTAMDFTSIYYSDGDQVILIQADKADTYTSLASFAGKTVAGQNGSLQMDMITTQLLETTPQPFVDIRMAVNMLMTGKIEGVALASVVAEQYVANYPDALAICAEKFAYESLGVVGAVPKGETEWLAAVNEAIDKVIEEGLYYTWIDEANALQNSLQ
ncbi:MAG: transporter substrate-binding domain-containing protein [Oscillospiraceae bacterium]|jgi:polar amino acid transport system substrate-binding protein|nr:transporter substrate-binding domain-containing protein [Oscillospiraceae bacterium]